MKNKTLEWFQNGLDRSTTDPSLPTPTMPRKLEQNSPSYCTKFMFALFPITVVLQTVLAFSDGAIFIAGLQAQDLDGDGAPPFSASQVPFQLVWSWIPLVSTLVLLGSTLSLLVHYPPCAVRFEAGMSLHFISATVIITLKWISHFTTPSWAIVALFTLVLLHVVFPLLYRKLNGGPGFDFGITPTGKLFSAVFRALASLGESLGNGLKEVNNLSRGRWSTRDEETT